MGIYDGLPVLNLDLLMPQAMTRFRVQDDGVEGGRNGNGQSQVISFGGGGRLTGGYRQCVISTAEQHEYVEQIEARLAGSFRYINVPIITDLAAPLPLTGEIPVRRYDRLFDADGSVVDGAIANVDSVTAAFTADAAVGAGQVALSLSGAARALSYGLWFSVFHTNKGWRAYSVWQINAASHPAYTVAISPPLREAVTIGQSIKVVRPLCVMRYPLGFTSEADVSAYYQQRPDFIFEEAP